MHDYENAIPTYEFGFRLIHGKDKLKAELDRNGPKGLVSLIGAYIGSGVNTWHAIQEKIAAIGGDHYDLQVADLLDHHCHAEDRLWFVVDGHYFLNR